MERQGPTSGQYLGARVAWASQPMFESRLDMIHGFSSKKGKEPSGLVERARELYGLTTKNLELVTS